MLYKHSLQYYKSLWSAMWWSPFSSWVNWVTKVERSAQSCARSEGRAGPELRLPGSSSAEWFPRLCWEEACPGFWPPRVPCGQHFTEAHCLGLAKVPWVPKTPPPWAKAPLWKGNQNIPKHHPCNPFLPRSLASPMLKSCPQMERQIEQ